MPIPFTGASRVLTFRPPAAVSRAAVCALALAACRSPEAEPLRPSELASAVETRAESSAVLAHALELADIGPLAVPAPAVEDPPRYDERDFWHASAYAYSAATRAARRRVEIARARVGSAGAPGPIELMAETDDLGDLDRETRVTLTFDLLGLLGAGRANAEKDLARAEVRASLGALEESVWSAGIEVDRARARLAAARAKLAALRELDGSTETGRKRIAILGEHGRLLAIALAEARLAHHTLLHHITEAESEVARAREALALAAGLPPSSPALDGVTEATLDALEPAASRVGVDPHRATSDSSSPSDLDLFAHHPTLRRMLVEYALAEARLADAAAATWPSLRIGPQVLFEPDDVLLGAALGSALEWPTAARGRIAAAIEERTLAREAAEDALLAAQNRLAGARERLARSLATRDEHAGPAERDAQDLWNASQALFLVDPAGLTEWARALSMRTDAVAMLADARLEAALAGLDLEEARGPEPQPEPPQSARAEIER